MARSYTAFLNRDRIPDLSALQSAIDALGFKLVVDEIYVPLQNSDYLPCTLDGEDAGLTLKFAKSDNVPGKDTALTLQWSGDPREQVSVMMLAATFAHGFAATVLDQHQQAISADALLAAARTQFANLD